MKNCCGRMRICTQAASGHCAPSLTAVAGNIWTSGMAGRTKTRWTAEDACLRSTHGPPSVFGSLWLSPGVFGEGVPLWGISCGQHRHATVLISTALQTARHGTQFTEYSPLITCQLRHHRPQHRCDLPVVFYFMFFFFHPLGGMSEGCVTGRFSAAILFWICLWASS